MKVRVYATYSCMCYPLPTSGSDLGNRSDEMEKKGNRPRLVDCNRNLEAQQESVLLKDELDCRVSVTAI